MSISTKKTTFLQNVDIFFAAMDTYPIDIQAQDIHQHAAHIASLLQRVSELESQMAVQEN